MAASGERWDVVTIRIRFFAILRDKAGRGMAEIDLPLNATIATAVEALQAKFPDIRPYMGRCAYAVNQNYVPAETVLHDGDELAIIPPVSGG